MEEEQIRQREDDEINLLDYLIVLAKRKKLIIGITLGAALITAIISFIIPPKYRAEARILPPQQSSSMAAQLLSQFGDTTGMVSGISGMLGIRNPIDLYVGMIKSRTVYDRIIDRSDLMKLYNNKYREDARDGLDGVVNVKAGKDGIIILTVDDKDPKRAADIANAFVEELKNLTKGLAVTEASQRRLFFEEQLKDAKEVLIQAEEAMKGFQERTGALKIEEQAKAIIEGIAYLKAQIAAKEVEIRVMRTYSTPNNPDLQRAEESLRGLKTELSKLEAKGGSGHDPLMPTGRMPAVGTIL